VVDAQRTWRQNIAAAPVTSHGVYGYNIRRCRCPVCCSAKAAYRAAGKARRNGVRGHVKVPTGGQQKVATGGH